MSEYQYYEFQALDRPLTPQEQAEIRKLSSRVQPTATHAVFTYSWGDFRGDPLVVLEQYYDAMLYAANWGSRQIAFRFPRQALDLSRLAPYQHSTDRIEVKTTQKHVLLSLEYEDEYGGGEWIDGEGMLGTLAPLREDILRGDLRALYLTWLSAAALESGYGRREAATWGHDNDNDDDYDEYDEYDDELSDEQGSTDLLEPPVPPGLQQLTASLQGLIEFFSIDPALVVAAATASPSLEERETPVEEGLALLPEDERMDYLARVARGEAGVAHELRRRLRELAGGAQPSPASPRRTFSQLAEAAAELRRQREERERRAAEMARRQRLAALAKQEPQAWTQVSQLLDQKQGRAYDEAVALLAELRDLAEEQGRREEFDRRLADLLAGFRVRPGLMQRLRQAGLL